MLSGAKRPKASAFISIMMLLETEALAALQAAGFVMLARPSAYDNQYLYYIRLLIAGAKVISGIGRREFEALSLSLRVSVSNCVNILMNVENLSPCGLRAKMRAGPLGSFFLKFTRPK